MKPTLGAFVGALLLTALTSHAGWAFGVKDVVAMHRDGVADSLIMEKIHYSDTVFHLDARDIRTLQDAGVSDDVISAMLKTEGREHDGPYDLRPYHYYPYYAPYYYRYYPRVVVGFRFGYGYRGGFRPWHRF